MRTIIYGVFNKETNERVYTNCRAQKCMEFIETLENREKFEIRHKWQSF
jgi:hypothetical protein